MTNKDKFEIGQIKRRTNLDKETNTERRCNMQAFLDYEIKNVSGEPYEK